MSLWRAGCGFLAVLPLALQSPPDGWRNIENKTKGLAVWLPTVFEEIPVPPGEEHLQLKFTEKESSRNRGQFRAEVWILSIDKPDVSTGEEAAQAAKAKIRDLESWLKARKWDLRPDGSLNRDKTDPMKRYKILGPGSGKLTGVGFVDELPTGSLVYMGFCHPDDMGDFLKVFEKSAKSLREIEIEDNLPSTIENYYRTHPFRSVDYRKEVRRNLAKGWKADDTENYIMIYSTKDKYLLAKIKNDLEAVRTKYLELFPPAKPIEAVSTVRICKDRDEFQKFSGVPPQVAGFWNSGTEELVFFDANADPTIHNLGRKDSYIVLYHEAFHQYIHYACGEIAPHSWFNEGHGDYFSGSAIGRGGKKVDRIDINPWRIGTVKTLVEKSDYARLKEFVRFEQPKYYEQGRAGFNYAQGWSFVYFLRESKTVKKHPVWSGILERYFKTLQSSYGEKLAALGEKPGGEAIAKAQFAARHAATEEAFREVDFDEIEKEWGAFVAKLKNPTK